jgi:hypothetical protein
MQDKEYKSMSMTACLYALSFGAHTNELDFINLETAPRTSTFTQKLEAWQQRVCQAGTRQDNTTLFAELKAIHKDGNSGK